MPGFGEIVQKAFYLGVGLAATAGEEAGGRLAKLRVQAQKLADELVAKGEITAEEARRLVDDMIQQAQQQQTVEPTQTKAPSEPQPRRIEIVSEDEPTPTDAEVEAMRNQVETLREELNRLKRDG